MSKSLRKRGPPWSRRQAATIRSRRLLSVRSAFEQVRASMNPTTSTPRSGRYSTTGAPTPDAAAATELWYSSSRSMASRPAFGVGDPHHQAAVAGGHFQIPVGEPAGQVIDAVAPPGQAPQLAEQRPGVG